MTEITSEIRFEKARKRLATALENLENVFKNKLHEEAAASRIVNSKEESEIKLAQQEIIIQNLNLEINHLQQNLSDLGRETEFLNEKNKIFAEKLAKARQERLEIIGAINADLEIISNALKMSEDS